MADNEKLTLGSKIPAQQPTAEKRASSAGSKVTVACKHPGGLLLELGRGHVQKTPVLGGGVRDEEISVRTGKTVRIHGNAVPYGQTPSMQMIGGYALTPGVDKEFWDAWVAQNEGSPLLENGIIFASESYDATAGQAREHAKLLTGLEPLSTVMNAKGQMQDPRIDKGNKNVSAPQPDGAA